MRASRLFLGMILIALAAFGAFYAYQRGATQPVQAQNPPAPAAAIAVPVVAVKKEDVPVFLDYVATTEAMRMPRSPGERLTAAMTPAAPLCGTYGTVKPKWKRAESRIGGSPPETSTWTL